VEIQLKALEPQIRAKGGKGVCVGCGSDWLKDDYTIALEKG